MFLCPALLLIIIALLDWIFLFPQTLRADTSESRSKDFITFISHSVLLPTREKNYKNDQNQNVYDAQRRFSSHSKNADMTFPYLSFGCRWIIDRERDDSAVDWSKSTEALRCGFVKPADASYHKHTYTPGWMHTIRERDEQQEAVPPST